MQIAFIHAGTPGSVDATLNALVLRLACDGQRVIGVVQEPSADGGRHRCDMDLIDIPSGARFSISQNLGGGSTACRLAPDAVEAAAGRVADALDHAPADLLVINRFGKLEAMGRGFCPVIVEALALGVPVLVGVNDLNRPAFDEFSAGFATELPDALDPVINWVIPLLRKVAA